MASKSNSSPFKTLVPSQFKQLTILNTIKFSHLSRRYLHIAVVDTPVPYAAADHSPRIGVLIVPDRRETDWIFCTESGHFQLLIHFNLSRLILIGNHIDPNSAPLNYTRPPALDPVVKSTLEDKVKRLVLEYYPQVSLRYGLPKPLFLTYQNDVVSSFMLERFVGPSVGEFVVQDVLLDSQQFRRRLRFKTTPNVTQSQVLIRKDKDGPDLIDKSVLVEPYLKAMVSALFMIVSPLYELLRHEISPRALCLGVGGGSLLSFLHNHLGFEVVGVEIDVDVLRAARKYFGLQDSTSFQLVVGDAIEEIQKAAYDGLNKFDVVMVDLISNVAKSRNTAPPHEFCSTFVFQAIRSLLHDHGALVIYVVPPDQRFYQTLIQMLKMVFNQVFQIDEIGRETFVLMATLKPSASSFRANVFLKRLGSGISEPYLHSTKQL